MPMSIRTVIGLGVVKVGMGLSSNMVSVWRHRDAALSEPNR